LEQGVCKVYQPEDKKYKWSWLYSDLNELNKPKEIIYWLDDLPTHCKKIFIVEGLKDCLVLNANFNEQGYYAIGLDTASQHISQSAIDKLKAKCDELVFCLDNDNTGIQQNKKKAIEFDLPWLAYPKSKDTVNDFADFILNWDKDEILDWLKDTPRNFSDKPSSHSPSEPKQNGTAKSQKSKKAQNKTSMYEGEEVELLDEIIEILHTKPAKELSILKQQLKKEKAINIAEAYLSRHYSIRNNIIANRFEYSKILTGEFKELNPDEINREFQKRNVKFSLGAIKSLLKSDFVPEYNPFIDYFKDLPEWNENDKDYITELANHISTSDSKRFLYHFKKFIVRTVACAIDTEVVNKQCLVLVSPNQNNGKSTFCRFLAPPKLSEYIAENIGTDKDSLIALCQNFWINLDELSTLNKTEINALKSVFSKDVVKVRKPYDANPSMAHRVASFIGSTNRDEFLSDETGSVRWLCFDILNIDFAYSKLDINLIYAQAYALYKNGFEYQMTKADVEANEEANRKYKIVTMEKDILMQTIRAVSNEEFEANKDNAGYHALSMSEIVEMLQGTKKTTLKPYNITQALKDLGFIKKSIRKGNGNPYKAYMLQYISSLSTNDTESTQDKGYPDEWDE
jgi:hypothetical protein